MNDWNTLLGAAQNAIQTGQPLIRTEHHVGVSDDTYWKVGLMVLALMVLGTVIRVLIENKLKN